MLGHRPYFFELHKKYTALFGTLFNDIVIERRDADGALRDSIKVPLSYSHRDKMLARLIDAPDADKKVSVVLPRISFEMGDPTYNGRRAGGKIDQNTVRVDGGDYTVQFRPVPYDFPFTLWVYAKNLQDGHNIIEQILPFFTPNFSVTADLISEMNENRDIQIILNGPAQLDDKYQGDFKDRRVIVWKLNFTLQGWLWGPIKDHPIIKFANVSFYDATKFDPITDAVGNTTAIDRVTAQPGLLANGSPTTNVAASVPYADIEVDDDWGYAVKIYGTLLPGDGSGGADEPVEDE